jgi:hypothetical protein
MCAVFVAKPMSWLTSDDYSTYGTVVTEEDTEEEEEEFTLG